MDTLEKQIQKELTRLDPDLFLDKVRHPEGYVYYCVRYNIGSAVEPLMVVEWNMPKTIGSHPLPLSWKIVDQVKSQEGDIRDSIREVKLNNEVLREKRRQEFLQQLEEAAQEAHSFGKIRRFYGNFRKISS